MGGASRGNDEHQYGQYDCEDCTGEHLVSGEVGGPAPVAAVMTLLEVLSGCLSG